MGNPGHSHGSLLYSFIDSGVSATLGSYSYIPHGGSLQMARDLQAKTESGLYFAGEATSATDMQMAHGAMETGIAAAKELIADLFDTGQLLNTYKQLRQYRIANPARQRIPTSELTWFVKHGDKADFCQAYSGKRQKTTRWLGTQVQITEKFRSGDLFGFRDFCV